MQPLFEEPGQREARPEWRDVPEEIVSRLQALLGEKIIRAEISWGGYSPSATFSATLESGKKVFLKGTHPGQDAHGTKMLQDEIEAYQNFSDIGDFSPAYIGCVSDGSEDGWMLAAFDYIDAAPTLPWTPDKIEKAFGLLSRLHSRQTDALLPARKKKFIEKFLRPAGGWLRLRDDPAIAAKFLTLFENENAGRQWLLEALPKLCGQQSKVADIDGPVGVIHQDLRSDNILFDTSGKAYFIDWPNVCQGPVVLDLAHFLPTVCAESGRDPEKMLALYSKISGAGIPRDHLASALASSSGHLADNVYRAVPPKLPRLRWMQKGTLWAMLQWAVVLIDIPPPPRFTGLRHDG